MGDKYDNGNVAQYETQNRFRNLVNLTANNSYTQSITNVPL